MKKLIFILFLLPVLAFGQVRHVVPNTTNTTDLGTASLYWRNLYITNINGIAPGNWTLKNDSSKLYELISRKVTSVSGASTDLQYPSAKLFYDRLLLKLALADTSSMLGKYARKQSPTFTGTVAGITSAMTGSVALADSANGSGAAGKWASGKQLNTHTGLTTTAHGGIIASNATVFNGVTIAPEATGFRLTGGTSPVALYVDVSGAVSAFVAGEAVPIANAIANQNGAKLVAQTAKFSISDTIKTAGKVIGGIIKTTSGTGTQFMMADGSVRDTVYQKNLPTGSADDILVFDGLNWVPKPGIIGASNGITEYLNDTDSPDVTDAKYLYLSRTPITTSETSVTASVASANSPQEIKSFIMSSTGIGVTTLPAGVWNFNIYAKNSAGTTAGFEILVYAATVSGGAVTLGTPLFTTVNQTLTSILTGYDIDVIQPAFTGLTAAHRLVLLFRATQTASPSRDVTIYLGGSAHASHVHTPLQTRHNDLAGLNVGDYKHLTSAESTALSGLTASEIAITNASGDLASAAVATYPSLTELTYLKGVTSAVQTQINGKQASGSYRTLADTTANTGTATVYDVSLKANLASPTFTGTVTAPAITLPTNGQILLTVPTTDGHATGNVTNAFVSGYTSSAIGDLVYLDVNRKWQKTDMGTSVATYGGFLGIALEVKDTDQTMKVALSGSFVYATGFPALTIGSPVWMGDAGAIVVTRPSTADHAVRMIGWACHADKIFFCPSADYIIHL